MLLREYDWKLICYGLLQNVMQAWNKAAQTRRYDGPAYVTQCPIQTGQSYTYNFTLTGQRGTLFWYAHISWLRAVLYRPIIILAVLIEIVDSCDLFSSDVL